MHISLKGSVTIILYAHCAFIGDDEFELVSGACPQSILVGDFLSLPIEKLLFTI